jgi:AraC family transcriptional regulator
MNAVTSVSFDNDNARAFPARAPLTMDRRAALGRHPEERLARGWPGHAGEPDPTELKHPVVEISQADMVTRQTLTWPGMAAEFVTSSSHEKIEYRFRAPVHLLAVWEQGTRRDGETFVEGLPRSTLRDVARKLTFVPAGHEYSEWHTPRTCTSVIYFYIDPAKLPLPSELDMADMPAAPRLFFEDTTLWDTALKLKRSVESPTAANRLYAEALGVVLVHELMRLNRGKARVDAPVRGGLAAWQQRSVTAYIEEHLAESVPLAMLAELVRLSPYHFCRAFKQSFGVPPHRYHTARRIERAKTLLANPRLSVTDIGLTVGFSETSSFTAAFRKATGVTPTGYRRNLG